MEKFFEELAYVLFESDNNAWFLVSIEVINATPNLTKIVVTEHQEIILTVLDATSITSCRDVIQAFRNNKEIFVELFRHAEGLYGESIPMPRMVNRQANRANPLFHHCSFTSILILWFILRQCMGNLAKNVALILLIA